MGYSKAVSRLSKGLPAVEAPREETETVGFCSSYFLWIKHTVKVVKAHPSIFWSSLLLFCSICGTGLAIIFFKDKSNKEELDELALDLAIETGRWFSDQLDSAILPLFAMALFAQEVELFHDLPNQIGHAFEDGSLPFRQPSNPDGQITHRNVTGVCDDPAIVERFEKLASSIKRRANMEGVLVNVQLAPYGVVCLAYPLVNTEDFPQGIVLDSTGAIGHDLLTDPRRVFSAEATVKAEGEIIVQGPVTLRQCGSADQCDPTVQQAFIARAAVEMEDKEIVVDGVSYPSWGFATALINWGALVERSDIYDRFANRGYEFQLTRIDKVVDSETGDFVDEVVVLAQTENFHPDMHGVSTALETTNNEWEIAVAYEDDGLPAWVIGGMVATIVVSIAVTALYLRVQVQSLDLKSIRRKYMEDMAQPAKHRILHFIEESRLEEIKKSTAGNGSPNAGPNASSPIADFFPSTTVLFADIEGFSAWSSEREPGQVFTLLETLFRTFDKLAKKRAVFKVETIGDCYVAVTGFPIAQDDHAVRMIKFAKECVVVIPRLVESLAASLGPGTSELRMRFGIHSGSVTAGVMVGSQSRLQLFGDTMNTAAHMESTSVGGRIHLSQTTANLLSDSGIRRSLEVRKDKVYIKGKGDIQTYFLKERSVWRGKRIERNYHEDADYTEGSVASDSLFSDGDSLLGAEEIEFLQDGFGVDDVRDNLVEWHVDWMTKLLRQIVSKRKKKRKQQRSRSGAFVPQDNMIRRGDTVLDEVVEVIAMPKFDQSSAPKLSDIEAVEINPEVIVQLRMLVKVIQGLYKSNPFHNFEHASHVTMSVYKLLSRIVVPENVNYDQWSASKVAAELHNYTFGITSDPLTHFAIVFSALIHDTGHTGVPNGQLASEDPNLAERYQNKSLAEQNSVDISWMTLLKPEFKDLHACLFGDDSEFLRFRQLVVNVVLATDIFDKELKELRNLRWERAFNVDKLDETSETKSECSGTSSRFDGTHSNITSEPKQSAQSRSINRRATIVIEHVMQASDVAHTMQHWNVYLKWNEKLFQEMYAAWKKGRSSKDPSEGWYKGELWFFDNYVIPLARKLAECGVFGVASDECLLNAIENRKDWAMKGEEILAGMIERAQQFCAKARFDTVLEGDEDLQ